MHVVRSCHCQQFAAFFRHQLLIGRHHMLPGFQRPFGIRIGRTHTTDGLHHHTDLFVLLDFSEIVRHQMTVGAIVKMPY